MSGERLLDVLPTKFAPARRAEATTLAADVARFRNDALAVNLLAAAPGFYLILERSAESSLPARRCSLPGVTSIDDVIGMRPGEALRCSTPRSNQAAAASANSAGNAGAVRAILAQPDRAARCSGMPADADQR